MVIAYSLFLALLVGLCIAANHFYVSTLQRRLERRAKRIEMGGVATTAVSDRAVTQAVSEA